MKISKITIKQLFGIKEWQRDGKNIELVGDNGTGKTSVIDAIRYALTNSSDREFIVKNGETEGEIYIETDNGLSIDRKARTAMTDYKSVKQNGNVIPSPESFLKTIFTPLQLSPMEFISMDKKTQNATILDMIQYDWNLDTIKEWFGEIPRDVNYEQNILAVLNDIQAENGYYFMHRQDVNRDIRAKKAVMDDTKDIEIHPFTCEVTVTPTSISCSSSGNKAFLEDIDGGMEWAEETNNLIKDIMSEQTIKLTDLMKKKFGFDTVKVKPNSEDGFADFLEHRCG